jgi:ribonucleoside-diphosphate reductase beta chain
LLIDTLGLPETEFLEFKNYPAMKKKHDYLSNYNIKDFDPKNEEKVSELLKCIAVYSGFTEGLQLFGSFSMLMNFQRLGKMIGMTTIVDWSIRDENKHVEGMTHLFREIVKENKKLFNKDLKDSIYSICQEITNLEIEFINLIFDRANDNIEGINRNEVKNYIKYIADLRLRQLGLRKIYGVENPFEWMNELTSAPEHTNFFERRPTAYTKGGIIWDINNCEFKDE